MPLLAVEEIFNPWTPVYNEQILRKYRNVLYRPRFPFTSMKIGSLISAIIKQGKRKPKHFLQRWKDREDEKQHARQFLRDFAQNVLEADRLLFDFEKRIARQTRGNDFSDGTFLTGFGQALRCNTQYGCVWNIS